MERVSVSNTTASPIYVGATMIPPGESRDFPLADVPEHLLPAAPPAPEPVAAPDPIAELVRAAAKDILPALAALSDDDLARLGKLEQDAGDRARKSVLAAVREESLLRGELAHTLALEVPAIIAGLRTLEPRLLPRLRAAEAVGANRPELLSAIDDEATRRLGPPN